MDIKTRTETSSAYKDVPQTVHEILSATHKMTVAKKPKRVDVTRDYNRISNKRKKHGPPDKPSPPGSPSPNDPAIAGSDGFYDATSGSPIRRRRRKTDSKAVESDTTDDTASRSDASDDRATCSDGSNGEALSSPSRSILRQRLRDFDDRAGGDLSSQFLFRESNPCRPATLRGGFNNSPKKKKRRNSCCEDEGLPSHDTTVKRRKVA